MSVYKSLTPSEYIFLKKHFFTSYVKYVWRRIAHAGLVEEGWVVLEGTIRSNGKYFVDLFCH